MRLVGTRGAVNICTYTVVSKLNKNKQVMQNKKKQKTPKHDVESWTHFNTFAVLLF